MTKEIVSALAFVKINKPFIRYSLQNWWEEKALFNRTPSKIPGMTNLGEANQWDTDQAKGILRAHNSESFHPAPEEIIYGFKNITQDERIKKIEQTIRTSCIEPIEGNEQALLSILTLYKKNPEEGKKLINEFLSKIDYTSKAGCINARSSEAFMHISMKMLNPTEKDTLNNLSQVLSAKVFAETEKDIDEAENYGKVVEYFSGYIGKPVINTDGKEVLLTWEVIERFMEDTYMAGDDFREYLDKNPIKKNIMEPVPLKVESISLTNASSTPINTKEPTIDEKKGVPDAKFERFDVKTVKSLYDYAKNEKNGIEIKSDPDGRVRLKELIIDILSKKDVLFDVKTLIEVKNNNVEGGYDVKIPSGACDSLKNILSNIPDKKNTMEPIAQKVEPVLHMGAERVFFNFPSEGDAIGYLSSVQALIGNEALCKGVMGAKISNNQNNDAALKQGTHSFWLTHAQFLILQSKQESQFKADIEKVVQPVPNVEAVKPIPDKLKTEQLAKVNEANISKDKQNIGVTLATAVGAVSVINKHNNKSEFQWDIFPTQEGYVLRLPFDLSIKEQASEIEKFNNLSEKLGIKDLSVAMVEFPNPFNKGKPDNFLCVRNIEKINEIANTRIIDRKTLDALYAMHGAPKSEKGLALDGISSLYKLLEKSGMSAVVRGFHNNTDGYIVGVTNGQAFDLAMTLAMTKFNAIQNPKIEVQQSAAEKFGEVLSEYKKLSIMGINEMKGSQATNVPVYLKFMHGYIEAQLKSQKEGAALEPIPSKDKSSSMSFGEAVASLTATFESGFVSKYGKSSPLGIVINDIKEFQSTYENHEVPHPTKPLVTPVQPVQNSGIQIKYTDVQDNLKKIQDIINKQFPDVVAEVVDVNKGTLDVPDYQVYVKSYVKVKTEPGAEVRSMAEVSAVFEVLKKHSKEYGFTVDEKSEMGSVLLKVINPQIPLKEDMISKLNSSYDNVLPVEKHNFQMGTLKGFIENKMKMNVERVLSTKSDCEDFNDLRIHIKPKIGTDNQLEFKALEKALSDNGSSVGVTCKIQDDYLLIQLAPKSKMPLGFCNNLNESYNANLANLVKLQVEEINKLNALIDRVQDRVRQRQFVPSIFGGPSESSKSGIILGMIGKVKKLNEKGLNNSKKLEILTKLKDDIHTQAMADGTESYTAQKVKTIFQDQKVEPANPSHFKRK